MYKTMVEKARQRGIATERAMLASVDRVDSLLEKMKDEHPEEYWKFIRCTHEDMYGSHYDDEFAKYDVAQMHSTDKEGHEVRGEHWTKEEVKAATQGKVFPTGTTDCDKYVAYNAIWHDLHKHYGDTDILTIAYEFFFADEDYDGDGKIWEYMQHIK